MRVTMEFNGLIISSLKYVDIYMQFLGRGLHIILQSVGLVPYEPAKLHGSYGFVG